MNKMASEVMGEPVSIGIRVSSRGEASKMIARGVGGAIGGAIAGAMSGKNGVVTTPENYRGTMYIALGTSKIGFFSVKQGFFKNSLDELLAEYPHSEVSTMRVQHGAIPKIDVILVDGSHFGFECGRMFLKDVKKMIDLLHK